MKGLFRGLVRWLPSGRRAIVAVVAGAAFLLTPGSWMARAEARPSKARADLVRGAGAGVSDAEGSLEVVRDARGDRVKVRVRNLEPRTQYEVRDAATRERVAGFRTNRSGRGKARLAAGGLTDAGIEICQEGAEDPVLEGGLPGDDEFYPPWEEMSFRTGTVSTDWDAAVQASITLTSIGDPASEEGTFESMDLWVSGTGVTGPVTLWIADDEGVLQQVASVEAFDGQDPMPLPPDGDPLLGAWNGLPGMDGTSEPTAAGTGMHSRRARRMMKSHPAADDGSSTNCPIGDGSGDWGDWGGWIGPDTFFSWTASHGTEEGLPFGLTAAADFSGRGFEVRDGDGNVILSGELPALEEIVFEPMPMPDPSEWENWTGGGVSIDINIDVSIFLQWGEGDPSTDLQGLFDQWMALLNGWK